jgi:hypothetical protein
MNPFQKQLILRGGRSMAELSNPARGGIGQPLPPVKVSVEEWYGGAPNHHRSECRRLREQWLGEQP